jgi:hypothetical protein
MGILLLVLAILVSVMVLQDFGGRGADLPRIILIQV